MLPEYAQHMQQQQQHGIPFAPQSPTARLDRYMFHQHLFAMHGGALPC